MAKDKKQDEITKELEEIANSQNVVIMSFIAPDTYVRSSPISYDSASIRVSDLYEIEKRISELGENFPKKLHLIIHTPGGSLFASVKIAKYLQAIFNDNIKAFVPYLAASGGTMMCLAANQVVMDVTSNLSPIDPQIPYKDTYISATSYDQAVKEYLNKYGNLRPDEIPSPYKQLCDQFDPIILKEMNKTCVDVFNSAWELQLKARKPKSEKDKNEIFSVVWSLALKELPHSHVIDIEEAENIGLIIDKTPDSIKILKSYKEWVSKKISEEKAQHIIEIYAPKKDAKQKDETPKETKNK